MESKYMDEKILTRIYSILEHINQVLEDTKGVSLEELRESNLLLRPTCLESHKSIYKNTSHYVTM